MSSLGEDDIRHALRIARDFGLRSVRLRSGETTFRAVLGEGSSEASEPMTLAAIETSEPGPALRDVTAPAVGYFREAASPLEVGSTVEAGQVVAEVVGLGLANDVTAPIDGEVAEVLVAAGDAVEFGQVLARVKA